tara:strand:+ start:138 stop:1190 length:1053 start_codon:yes stop_codon:yes gene_type:complete
MFRDLKKKSCWLALVSLIVGASVNKGVAQKLNSELTEYSHPNLQGFWTNPYQTPLERPLTLGNKRFYSNSEAETLRKQAIAVDEKRRAPLDPHRPAPELGGQLNNQADGNFEIMPVELAQISGEFRTSLIVEPSSGRIPWRVGGKDIHQQWRDQGKGRFDGPEGMTPLDRCLTPGGQLPLIYMFGGVETALGNPAGDNPVRNIQIVQNKDYVVILSEYFSLVRIIRIDSEFMPELGRKWMGDSIGYYEGNSLIVYTKNFREEQSITPLRSSADFQVKEVYTKIDENEILFQYTINDPNIYRDRWVAEIPIRRMEAELKLYEYACHEGNYSLPIMLRAARMEEAGLLLPRR